MLPWLSKYLHQLRGVRFEDRKDVFLGRDVILDNSHPEHVHIEKGVTIAARCIVLAHEVNKEKFRKGILLMNCKQTVLKEKCFIGCNSVIVAGVTIGKYAIVGANSTVTRDVPNCSIVAGNPAKKLSESEADPKN